MFKSARKPVTAAAVIIGLCVCALGQAARVKEEARGREVKVHNDRYTGERTIRFEPQLILDQRDHRMSLSAEAKLGGTKSRRGYDELDNKVTLTFTSMSNFAVDLGDNQLHFLVDGECVRGGTPARRMPFSTGNEQLPVGGHRVIVLPLSRVQQIARGGDVQMRLGPIELTLDGKVRSVLREFVAACGHTNP